MVHLTFKASVSAKRWYENDFFILIQIQLIFTKKVLHLASFPHEFFDSLKVTILILKSLLDQSFYWSSEDCCFVDVDVWDFCYFFIDFKPKTGKPLCIKTSKPNFVTIFVYFGTACLIICEFSLFVTAANRKAILLVTYASLASLARRNWRWISE